MTLLPKRVENNCALQSILRATFDDINKFSQEQYAILEKALSKNNKKCVLKVVNVLFSGREKIVSEYKQLKANDDLWVHRYKSLFDEICHDEGLIVKEYFASLFNMDLYDVQKRRNKLNKFYTHFLEKNMHAYLVAEILRPTLSLILDVLCRHIDEENIFNIKIFVELDLRLAVLIAEEKVYRALDERQSAIESTIFTYKSLANSDRLYNSFGMLLTDFEKLVLATKSSNTKNSKKIAARYSQEKFWDYKTYIEDMGRLFYSHGNGKTTLAHLRFLVEYVFAIDSVCIHFEIESNSLLEYEIEIPEFSFLKAFYPVLENAIDNNAKNVLIEFCQGQNQNILIKVSNDGNRISEFARKHCFDRFFSTHHPRKQGLGLFITKQYINRLGADIRVEDSDEPVFVFDFKLIYKKSGRK